MSAAPCPICAKAAQEKYAPFCSKRCADIDLSRWLKGGYAIPGRSAAEDEEAETPLERPKNGGFPREEDA